MDRISRQRRSWNMARIPSKGSRPEMRVRRLLYSMGFRYRLHRMDLPGRPDIVFATKRKIVQVHGCYWHGHGCARDHKPTSSEAYWSEKIAKNRTRDERSMKLLSELGWDVLVVWECEIDRIDQLRLRLRDFLSQASQSAWTIS
ncbi:very short patch repair endonuclease [Devosia insulae DS-56]|uniref:Very short patch repair endonuclease n=1 Tax=Devosia insulae DS-56 TaxID=1116389 RepID=A0A1E5XR56_9HYPH|nr:very short patch repair endonuclease [Devosia insulae]OEO31092.1 very short patch repair endonuclease [Devosia insulae DS-56]